MSRFTSATASNAHAFDDATASRPPSLRHSGLSSASANDLPDRFNARTIHYGRARKVFEEGQPARAVFQIESGAVLLLKIEGNSRRRLLEVLSAGAFFGMAPGLQYDCQAETMMPTVVRQIARGSVDQSALLKARIIEQRVRQLEELHAHRQAANGSSAMEKVASFLLRLPNAAQTTVYKAMPTQQDIASYLGLSVETVCRAMRHLRQEKIICMLARDKLAILEMERLSELAVS